MGAMADTPAETRWVVRTTRELVCALLVVAFIAALLGARTRLPDDASLTVLAVVLLVGVGALRRSFRVRRRSRERDRGARRVRGERWRQQQQDRSSRGWG
jgi:uncharacterized membrane protein YfcA